MSSSLAVASSAGLTATRRVIVTFVVGFGLVAFARCGGMVSGRNNAPYCADASAYGWCGIDGGTCSLQRRNCGTELADCPCEHGIWNCPATQCTDAGPECIDGQTRQIDCYMCTCSELRWNCTPKNCFDSDARSSLSDPGNVQCDGKPCAVADHFCCDQKNAASCMPRPRPGTCAGPQRECDEAADCADGNVCCIPPNQAVTLAYFATCAKTCGLNDPFSYQLCKTDSECENGKPCIGQPCLGTMIGNCGGSIPQQRCQ